MRSFLKTSKNISMISHWFPQFRTHFQTCLFRKIIISQKYIKIHHYYFKYYHFSTSCYSAADNRNTLIRIKYPTTFPALENRQVGFDRQWKDSESDDVNLNSEWMKQYLNEKERVAFWNWSQCQHQPPLLMEWQLYKNRSRFVCEYQRDFDGTHYTLRLWAAKSQTGQR